METSIGMRNAHVLSLSSVYGVSQNPAALPAMRIHLLPTEVALEASSNAGDDDPVSDVKLRDGGSHLLDETNSFVSENTAVGDGREISFQNVKIGSANSGSGKSDDGIAGKLNGGARLVLPCVLARTMINQGLPTGAGTWSCGCGSRELSSCHRYSELRVKRLIVDRCTISGCRILHTARRQEREL